MKEGLGKRKISFGRKRKCKFEDKVQTKNVEKNTFKQKVKKVRKKVLNLLNIL